MRRVVKRLQRLQPHSVRLFSQFAQAARLKIAKPYKYFLSKEYGAQDGNTYNFFVRLDYIDCLGKDHPKQETYLKESLNDWYKLTSSHTPKPLPELLNILSRYRYFNIELPMADAHSLLLHPHLKHLDYLQALLLSHYPRDFADISTYSVNVDISRLRQITSFVHDAKPNQLARISLQELFELDIKDLDKKLAPAVRF